jgi:histone H3/H4
VTDETKEVQVIIETRVREVAGNFRLTGDFVTHLNKKVSDLILAAAARAESNGRKTLQPHDL